MLPRISCFVLFTTSALGLQIHPAVHSRCHCRNSPLVMASTDDSAEARLIGLLEAGSSAASIREAIESLEQLGGVASPALSPLIEGEWKLVHTSGSSFDPRNPLGRRTDGTSPGLEAFFSKVLGGDGSEIAASSSPIQRAVTDAFSVVQELRGLSPQSGDGRGRVEQRVFTPVGILHLNAAASVRPESPARVNFAFDEGYFEFKQSGLPRVPYPVPFKLLGKEAEGYLDTTYLSDSLRISTGNKGTQFVLTRAVP
jgi:hypothetical protein